MTVSKMMRVVTDWKNGWKWFSNWAFVAVVFLATEPLPPEVIALLPPVVQDRLIAIVAIAGLLLRFVSQSKKMADTK